MQQIRDQKEVVEGMNLPFEPAPLQLLDAKEAAAHNRYALCYDVGGGKTLVSTITHLMWDEPFNIITCPPILLPQWKAWLESVNEKDVSIFAGPKRTVEMLDHKWVVMSHAIFRDSYDDIDKFYRGKDVAITIDEGQALKNPRSVLFRSFYRFITPDRRALLLTATPTSKPQDTYSYMRIKTPLLYRSMGHWENVHVANRDQFGQITEYRNLEQLEENFHIQLVKRTKRELFGDTLEPVHQPMPYHLSAKHMKLYYKLAEEQLLLLPTGDKIDATSAQRLRHAIQQIIINFAKFSGNEDDLSVAFDLLESVVEQVDPMTDGKSKLAIWTYYQSSSALVAKFLSDRFGAKAVAAAYGAVDSAKSVKRIMEDPECRFLVAQPTSVGVGLNLQHVCHEMLYLEIPTVPMYVRQANGRVDRAGQKTRPTIRYGQAQGTIQLKLFHDLLANDDLVSRVERSPTSLRDEIFGAL